MGRLGEEAEAPYTPPWGPRYQPFRKGHILFGFLLDGAASRA